MSARNPLPAPLLAVTDRHGQERPLTGTVRAVLDGGCRWVWFRERDMAPLERGGLAAAVLATVRAAGGTISIGGDPELAARLGADGVHLGGGRGADAITEARRRLGAGALIGASCHSLAEIETAAVAGADYATLSPIFATASKPGYGPALGVSVLRAAAGIGLPVVALGGLGPGNVPDCRAAGAAGLAVMGGLMRADDPGGATCRYVEAWFGSPSGR